MGCSFHQPKFAMMRCSLWASTIKSKKKLTYRNATSHFSATERKNNLCDCMQLHFLSSTTSHMSWVWLTYISYPRLNHGGGPFFKGNLKCKSKAMSALCQKTRYLTPFHSLYPKNLADTKKTSISLIFSCKKTKDFFGCKSPRQNFTRNQRHCW